MGQAGRIGPPGVQVTRWGCPIGRGCPVRRLMMMLGAVSTAALDARVSAACAAHRLPPSPPPPPLPAGHGTTRLWLLRPASGGRRAQKAHPPGAGAGRARWHQEGCAGKQPLPAGRLPAAAGQQQAPLAAGPSSMKGAPAAAATPWHAGGQGWRHRVRSTGRGRIVEPLFPDQEALVRLMNRSATPPCPLPLAQQPKRKPAAGASSAMGLRGPARELPAPRVAHFATVRRASRVGPRLLCVPAARVFARRHPSNFRNMARVWEKEHDHYEAEKKKADAKAEFEAEQNFLQTLSMLRCAQVARHSFCMTRTDRLSSRGAAGAARAGQACWWDPRCVGDAVLRGAARAVGSCRQAALGLPFAQRAGIASPRRLKAPPCALPAAAQPGGAGEVSAAPVGLLPLVSGGGGRLLSALPPARMLYAVDSSSSRCNAVVAGTWHLQRCFPPSPTPATAAACLQHEASGI